jgi:uncharacterized protein YjbI with pentapeptide repeats
MANAKHLALLEQGVDVWNDWRMKELLTVPDLREANLRSWNLAGANLKGADLIEADLTGANLSEVNLSGANLFGARLVQAKLTGARLEQANFVTADLGSAILTGANLSGAQLVEADLFLANFAGFPEANLSGANLSLANIRGADLSGADLSGAHLEQANLHQAILRDANLREANLRGALLLETDLTDADLTGCRVYGVSTWNVKLSGDTRQQALVITAPGEPEITVDNIEVAQFVYLLLHNEKIRDIIDTVGRKGVLLLGRFTEDRIAVLDRLRDELRKRGYLPVVFNFDKPERRDFTETVRLLAGLSKFVIADLSSPKSVPYEQGAIVSQTMIPFQPIIAAAEPPFAMLQDLWINYPDRVFQPIHYSSVHALIASLDEKIVWPAEARSVELVRRKGETMGGEHV